MPFRYVVHSNKTLRPPAVTRSRDPNILENCDIVVDVGAIYDHEKSRYDHHQRGFEEIFGFGYNTKLSSAGLIYKQLSFLIQKALYSDAYTDTSAKKSSAVGWACLLMTQK